MTNAIAVSILAAFDTSNDGAGVEREIAATERRWPSGSQPISVVEDLTMQVLLDDGKWHCKCVGGLVSKCGRHRINYALVLEMRQESYLGALCGDGCFSHFELTELAPLAQAEAAAEDEVAIEKLEADRKKTFDKLRDKRKPKK